MLKRMSPQALAGWLLVPLLAPLPPNAMAQAQMSVTANSVGVQWQGPGPQDSLQAPWFAEHHDSGADASHHVRSSIADGRVQAFPDSRTFLGVVSAYSSLSLRFENTGSVPIVFAAGDLRAELDVNMLRLAGGAPSGFGSTSVSGWLSGFLPGRAPGLAQLSYTALAQGNRLLQITYAEDERGGFNVAAALDPFGLALRAGLSAPAFTLGVGQGLEFLVSMQVVAVSGPQDASGGAAEVDGFFTDNGLQLFLALPAGVTVISPVSLSWLHATAVPEPPLALLMLAGLAGVARRVARAPTPGR